MSKTTTEEPQMTTAAKHTNRHYFDVRVWFDNDSQITACNIRDDRTPWNRDNAMRSAERSATQPQYADRGGVRAVAIIRSFVAPNSRPSNATTA